MQRFYLHRLEHLKEFEWDAIRQELAVFVIECHLAIHAPIGGSHFGLDSRLWRAILDKIIPNPGPTVSSAHRDILATSGAIVFHNFIKSSLENHINVKFGDSVSKEIVSGLVECINNDTVAALCFRKIVKSAKFPFPVDTRILDNSALPPLRDALYVTCSIVVLHRFPFPALSDWFAPLLLPILQRVEMILQHPKFRKLVPGVPIPDVKPSIPMSSFYIPQAAASPRPVAPVVRALPDNSAPTDKSMTQTESKVRKFKPWFMIYSSFEEKIAAREKHLSEAKKVTQQEKKAEKKGERKPLAEVSRNMPRTNRRTSGQGTKDEKQKTKAKVDQKDKTKQNENEKREPRTRRAKSKDAGNSATA